MSDRWLRILHLSDLHFGEPFVPEVAEAVLETAHNSDIDVIVISGDITQRAKEPEFQAAKQWIDRLPSLPLVVVPGNHDAPLYRVWERFTNPLGLYKKYIHDEPDHVLRHDKATFVGLNTTDPRKAISNGRIRGYQLDFAEKAFKDSNNDEAWRIVVAHHHFIPAPDYRRPSHMPKAKRALDLFCRYDTDIILGGHLHRAYTGNSLDVHAGEDREHGIIVVQCGTTTSRRGRGGEREKNTLNLIDLHADKVVVTHHMHFEDGDGFAPVSQHEFARPTRHVLHQGLAEHEGTAG